MIILRISLLMNQEYVLLKNNKARDVRALLLELRFHTSCSLHDFRRGIFS